MGRSNKRNLAESLCDDQGLQLYSLKEYIAKFGFVKTPSWIVTAPNSKYFIMAGANLDEILNELNLKRTSTTISSHTSQISEICTSGSFQFPIEKNIPFEHRRKFQLMPYPFKEMVPGDSFFIPCGKTETSKCENALRSFFTQWKKQGREHILKTCETGIRVWRMK